MNPKIALAAFVLMLGAALPAAAQDQPDVVYQNALLARALPPADKAFCDGKAGAEKSAASDACRVTRLFLVDIDAGKDKGFPPLTDIKYAQNKEEKGKILDRM
ncbi:MAG: hypothetical protein HYX59_05500 [Elusimicrobia bacterium]|nr:hypothetical protein [Elusimicrobiota bacterium]